MKKNIKISLCLNIIIFILVFFNIFASLFDFKFLTNFSFQTKPMWNIFQYFTIDSNLFAGIISLILAVKEIQFIKINKEITTRYFILKLLGGVSVSLTMLVTVFYLAPSSEHGYFSLFQDSNLFLHFIIPCLYIISFIFFEKNNLLKFKHSFLGISPMLIYGIYYLVNIIIHLENGYSSPKYDLYGFVKGGIQVSFIVFPIILVTTYLISLILFLLNKKRVKNVTQLEDRLDP